jgi:putative nucleotidyltransferase with HDIG domain
MKGERPQQKKPSGRPALSRKLTLAARFRNRVRAVADRILGADLVWSLLLVGVVVTILAGQRCGAPMERYVAGEVAPYDIRARYDFDVRDEILTAERRFEARDSVPELYVQDTERGIRLARELSTVFVMGREVLEPAEDVQLEGVERDGIFPDRIPQSTRELLAEKRFSTDIEGGLIGAIREVMRRPVVGNKAMLDGATEVSLLRVPGDREDTLSDFSGVLDLDQARDQVRARVQEAFDLAPDEEAALADLAALYVDANLAYDPEGTASRKDAAERATPPVLVRIPKGTVLIRKGERFSPEQVEKLEASLRASRGRLGVNEIVGMLAVVSMLAFFLHRYTVFHQRDFRKKVPHLHALLILVMLGMLLLTVGLMWLVQEVVGGLRVPFNDIEVYTYLIPIGAGAVLVTLLANGRVAVVYSAYTALLFGAIRGWDLYAATWALLVQFAGVFAISAYRNRAALLRAGLVLGGAGAAAALALEVLKSTTGPGAVSFYGVGLAFLGGAVGAGLLISFSLPILEFLFKVLTDVRLLELSNIDNPLLSQLAVKAPGSYNHSLVVGTLAEEGAKAIGANSLFCRVAAFYHDVGKMMKPEYYVENQRGENPHDRLSPPMSALIISSHVKDGIRMAREAGLPEQIVDIIPQHHGTRLMTFFYEKAKAQADPSLGSVKEQDFRYPGPRPQTREAAIFMLADAVEAAARTVDDPTPNRLREMIRKVTNAIVLDGQFEECDLTFADLDRLQEAFLRTLVSIYHHRVDYPGYDFGKGKSASSTRESNETDSRPARTGS